MSRQDLDFARELGADLAIDYKAQRFENEVHDLDLVFDLISGDTQVRSFAVLKPGGTLVSTLQQPDEAKSRQHRVRGLRYTAQPNGEELAEIAGLIATGKVKPVVSITLPLEHATEAQQKLETAHIRGKVVLICA